jgi:filamentous hemagglutinin family protein
VALPKVSLAFVAICALAAVMPRSAAAQNNITVDGHFSKGPVPYYNGVYSIDANLGKQVGGNLFHSFGKFGLATNETATFSGPTAVNNVIGRVTGGVRSDIDGRIKSDIAGANLFLINPSGIVFGQNAKVDVKASFHASTADYIKLSDGTKFQATNPDGSTLSAAPPAAFGFLTPSPARISVNGSTLSVPSGQTLGLVGGPVSIAASPIATAGARLAAPAGTIHVTSAAGTGEVPVDPPNASAMTVSNFGSVDIRGKSKLDVSDPKGLASGGSVFIRAGTLAIDASKINADNYGAGAGGQLMLQADSNIAVSNKAKIHAVARAGGSGGDIILQTSPGGTISLDNSTIKVGSIALGDGGTLSVTAGQLTLTNGAGLRSKAKASGNGGPIAITADTVLVDGGVALDQSTGIFSTTSGSGSGGSITIVAEQLTLHNGANVLAQNSGDGGGGNVDVNVGGSLTVDFGENSGFLNSGAIGSLTFGTGNAGNVTVTAGYLSILNGGVIGSETGGTGNAGNVTVTAGTLTIANFAEILADTAGVGNAGNVNINAGTLSIRNDGAISSGTFFNSGNGGDVFVNVAGQLTIDGDLGNTTALTGIAAQSNPGSIGNAGNVTVTARTLSITNNGSISAATFGDGSGGSIWVDVVDRLSIAGTSGPLATGIGSDAEPGSTGNAGNVTVNAGFLTLVSSGGISSNAIGARAIGPASTGNAGSVNVKVVGSLSIAGLGSAIETTSDPGTIGTAGSVMVSANSLAVSSGALIASTTAGSGKGGDVKVIVASDVLLSDPGPQITAQSSGSGNAGSITVSAARLLMNNGAAISTEATTANGGNITLNVSDLVYLLGSKITTSVNRETGSGGNITIDPQLVVLNHSRIIAQAAEGRGGNITINAGAFIPSADSIVDASSQTGISGTVVITGPRADVNGALVVLSSELRGRAAVLREACAAYGDRPVSSLVEAGRGGLPQDPEATLPALYIADRDLSPSLGAGAKTEPNSAPLQTTVRLSMHCG